jgi:16S rRNA C967 or C1407 C5-methylase (RsmB/RsmF family)
LLKKNGVLVYSTCTLEPQENEKVISKLLEENQDAQLLEINLNIKRSPPITSFQNETYNEEVKKCLRIYPQDNDTEGFFVAKITKKP